MLVSKYEYLKILLFTSRHPPFSVAKKKKKIWFAKKHYSTAIILFCYYFSNLSVLIQLLYSSGNKEKKAKESVSEKLANTDTNYEVCRTDSRKGRKHLCLI